MWIGDEELRLLLDEPADGVIGGQLVVEPASSRGRQTLGDMAECLAVESLLVGEVVIEQRRVHLRLGREVFYGRGGKPLLGEASNGRVQDHIAAGGGGNGGHRLN